MLVLQTIRQSLFFCLFVLSWLGFGGVFLATPQGMQGLSSPTRGQTHDPCSGSVTS